MTIEASFRALVDCLLKERPGFQFPPGATERELQEFEKSVGHALPDDVKAIYRMHNGEFPFGSKNIIGLFCDYEFLSLQHAAEAYSVLQGTRQAQTTGLAPDDTEYRSVPPRCVHDRMFESGWIPIGGYFSGNYLGIDLNPGPEGVIGQIINFGPDDEVHFQIAPDLASFLETVHARYTQRQWHSAYVGQDWS